ncbi:hypothetical protein C8R43DRAFT_889112 [Mycena crocata]|nr:hypothetical protein C8R43DRAFT_889112 [Mycena crocata]
MSQSAPSPPGSPRTDEHSTPDDPRLHRPSSIHSLVYLNRVTSGLYGKVADQMQEMGIAALSNVEYPGDFVRKVEKWGNYSFVDNEAQEFRFNLFGQILPPSLGTNLRAQGNHFHRDGETFIPINDKSKIKDTLALGIPTLAPTELYNLFINQGMPLRNVMITTAAEDARNGISCTRPTKDGGNLHDIIMVTMLPKYDIPAESGAPEVKLTTKRKLDAQGDDTGPAAHEPGKIVYPAGTFLFCDDIKLGAYYDPNLLGDYGGSYFNHVKGKLIQLDVRDASNALIPPWKFYDELKTGTLVLIHASFHCFTMANTDEVQKGGKEKRIFQINAHSIRVLDPSDEYVEKRTQPLAPDGLTRATAQLPARAASSSFTNFSVPTTPSTSPSKSSKSPSSRKKETTSTKPSSAGSGSSNTADDVDMDQVEDPVDDVSSKGKGKARRTRN